MIVPNQQNIKVHFAGGENLKLSTMLAEKADVKYFLFTVYPFIRKKQNYDTALIEKLQRVSRHTIMDSGLFTLMFGAEKGKKSPEFIEDWYQKIVKFVKATGYRGTVVEVDCQKVLGPEKAWEYRRRMKKDLPNNRQINVFHFEDGKEGLDRLIDFSDYIAISVPELRALGKKKHCESIAKYIKNRKHTIDIHLLGCTENKLLKELNYCSSADSTSWKMSQRWGLIEFINGGKVVKTASKRRPNSEGMVTIDFAKLSKKFGPEVLEYLGRDMTEKTLEGYVILLICAQEARKKYELLAGDQS